MVFILIGARVFSLTFYGVSGHVWVEHLLTSLPGGQIGFLIIVNVMVFVLAFFLDFFELAFIVVPLLGPAAEKLGIDLIWFGVMLGVNMQTSFMHPPFGFALFYLRSVAPRETYKDRVTGKMMEPVTTGQIYWGAVPFVVIQCIMVALSSPSRRWSCTTRRRTPRRPETASRARHPGQGDRPPPVDSGPPSQERQACEAGAHSARCQAQRAAWKRVTRRTFAHPRGARLAAACLTCRRRSDAAQKKPRARPGACSLAGRSALGAQRIMKLSKVNSATCHHRYSSFRKAFSCRRPS